MTFLPARASPLRVALTQMAALTWRSLSSTCRNGNLLQYSCLENPMDRGAWWAILHRVAKSQTRLKQLSTHTYNLCKLTFHHPETAFQVSMVQVTHLHQPETDSNLPTGIEKDENTYPTLLQDMEQKESSCIHFIKFHVIYIN